MSSSDKELQGCRAFPAGCGCPVEWCEESQHEAMCRGCRYFTSGRRVSLYQRRKRDADAR